jgi:hypothetical protein
VEAQWDNFKNECTTADENPAWVYAITEPATEVAETKATLNGGVNSENMETKYYFEYGTKSELGTKTAETTVGPSWENKKISQGITGLTAKTQYIFVVVGKNAKGTAKGRQLKFTTP